MMIIAIALFFGMLQSVGCEHANRPLLSALLDLFHRDGDRNHRPGDADILCDGVTKEIPLHLMAQKVRVMRVYERPSEVHRMAIARHILRRAK